MGQDLINFGESIGRSFTIVADNVQRKAMEGAGFVDIEEVDFKVGGARAANALSFPSFFFYSW